MGWRCGVVSEMSPEKADTPDLLGNLARAVASAGGEESRKYLDKPEIGHTCYLELEALYVGQRNPECAGCRAISKPQTKETQKGDREMNAFIAGWFAHARQRKQMFVEDAWHAYRIGDICPGCLKKPCECPVDDSAVRAIFEQVRYSPGEAGDPR
jgi:hypothetical protein